MASAKHVVLIGLLVALSNMLAAQKVYTIQADSVKITNCDSSELILENHSQGVKGFLYNTGNGRTVFKKGVVKVNDSLYLIGADSLKYNAWVQGGNAFKKTGVLGTLDTFNLDLYTNNVQRARLTKTGNFLLGTTTDNGNRLQVKGDASFTGDVGIGTATITNTGTLIGTNAILFNHFIPRYHNYSYSSPYIGKLDDVIYNFSNRLNTTFEYPGDGSVNIDIVFPPDELVDEHGIIYGRGRMFFSFWANGLPSMVSVMVKNYTGTWFGPYTSSTNLNIESGLYEAVIPGPNFVTEIKASLTPRPGGFVNLQNMEYVLDTDEEGLANPHPYVSKYFAEHIYDFFYLKNGGVDNVRLSPYPFQANYFMNHVLVGKMTDNGASLQVVGDVTTTGGVKFGGLTINNSPTRILVSDADGNLYYRDASTLAASDGLRSSLVVKGPVRARSLILDAAARDWPDYVFDSSYHLPNLRDVHRYIQLYKHLPGIPSAGKVNAGGIDVGWTQAALLQKIEELTLYAVEHEDELAMQKEKLDRQDKIIADQDARMKRVMERLDRLERINKKPE